MELLSDISQWAVKASLQGGLLAATLWLVYKTRRTAGLFGIQYVLGILVIARLCLPATPSVKIPAQRAGHWFGVYKTPGLSPQRGLSDSVVPTGSVIG